MVIPPHVCRCTSCHDFALPQDVLRPGHVAFRLHNTHRDTHVWFNDLDVTLDVIEACPGFDGFVVVHQLDSRGLRHYCTTCSRRVCIDKHIGKVAVSTAGEVYQ